ncbi:MAG: hypothetical protein CMJ49_03020 [Planctomycetaceae bacterium]|nr:hypothetical protein [Planctomycetaceae bacterium]
MQVAVRGNRVVVCGRGLDGVGERSDPGDGARTRVATGCGDRLHCGVVMDTGLRRMGGARL